MGKTSPSAGQWIKIRRRARHSCEGRGSARWPALLAQHLTALLDVIQQRLELGEIHDVSRPYWATKQVSDLWHRGHLIISAPKLFYRGLKAGISKLSGDTPKTLRWLKSAGGNSRNLLWHCGCRPHDLAGSRGKAKRRARRHLLAGTRPNRCLRSRGKSRRRRRKRNLGVGIESRLRRPPWPAWPRSQI